MNLEEIKQECHRLFKCSSISDGKTILDIYSELFFQLAYTQKEDHIRTQCEADATILNQMMLTKALHLKETIQGIKYRANNGCVLNNIIDPTIIASFTRNIFETASLFNLIYRYPKSEDEKRIIYLLWVHSGLKYRQRLGDNLKNEANKKKLQNENDQLLKISSEIESTNLFQQLNQKNQEKIRNRLNKKEFLIRFDEKEVVFLHWHNLPEIMDIQEGMLNNAYSYFSQYSHPSNVSVFQFADMFRKDDEPFIETTVFNLKIAFFMFGIFAADYINLFPNTLQVFERLSIRDQLVINFYNSAARGIEYSINDLWIKITQSR
jgi:hypothetical protein